jgi:hypothetical protein
MARNELDRLGQAFGNRRETGLRKENVLNAILGKSKEVKAVASIIFPC